MSSTNNPASIGGNETFADAATGVVKSIVAMPKPTGRFRCKDKVALVTGAAGDSIGRAVALELANREVRLIGLMDLNGDGLLETQNLIEQHCRTHSLRVCPTKILQANVTDTKVVHSVFRRLQKIGKDPVRVFVPTAGVTKSMLAAGYEEDPLDGRKKWKFCPIEEYCRQFEINLLAVYQMMQVFIQHIGDTQMGKWTPANGIQGAAVAPGSITALGGFKGVSIYGSLKAALQNLIETLRAEVSFKLGIQLNAIELGYVDTAMVRNSIQNPKIMEDITRRSLLGRMMTPGEVAKEICDIMEKPWLPAIVSVPNGKW